MANERIWYAVKCFDENSTPEDGIISCDVYWAIIRAPNVFKAYDMAKKRGLNAMVQYEDVINPETNKPYGYSRKFPDVRIAKREEVEDHIYWNILGSWEQRKRFKELSDGFTE